MKPRFCQFGHEVPEGSIFCKFGDDVDESYDPTAAPGPSAPQHRYDPAPAQLVLTFPAGELTLSRGDQIQLGRCLDLAYAHLFAAHDNVSRRHATVGVDDANGTWIRDDSSVNGTFINDHEIMPPKVPHPLNDGDRVRLGADLTARVRIDRNGESP